MFRITCYKNGKKQVENTNDINDLRDILINLINDEKIERNLVNWASNATFGGSTSIKNLIKVECVKETTDERRQTLNELKKARGEILANTIFNRTGIEYKFNEQSTPDKLRFDFNFGRSYAIFSKDDLAFYIKDLAGLDICIIQSKSDMEFVDRVDKAFKRIKITHDKIAKVIKKCMDDLMQKDVTRDLDLVFSNQEVMRLKNYVTSSAYVETVLLACRHKDFVKCYFTNNGQRAVQNVFEADSRGSKLKMRLSGIELELIDDKETNVWHMRYSSGESKKLDINDYITKYYRKNNPVTIKVIYSDKRSKRVTHYIIVNEITNEELGRFKKLSDAKAFAEKYN